MKRHGGSLNEYLLRSERSQPRKPHAVWFQLFNILEKANYGENSCRRVGGKRDEQRAQGTFAAVNPRCISWWICVITHLSASIEWTTPKVNPKANYRLWLIVTCQCRLTLSKNKQQQQQKQNPVPSGAWHCLMGQAIRGWGQGVHGKSPYFHFNFIVNLKLL